MTDYTLVSSVTQNSSSGIYLETILVPENGLMTIVESLGETTMHSLMHWKMSIPVPYKM